MKTKMGFVFFSPIDQGPVLGKTLQETRERALVYIGSEDWEGEPVTRITIYRLKSVEVVTAQPIAPADSQPAGAQPAVDNDLAWETMKRYRDEAWQIIKNKNEQIAILESAEKEWGVTWSSLRGHPGTRRQMRTPLTFDTEQEADDCIAGKMDCGPWNTREPDDVKKLVRTKAGPWVPADSLERTLCKTCGGKELVNGETCPNCLGYDCSPAPKEDK